MALKATEEPMLIRPRRALILEVKAIAYRGMARLLSIWDELVGGQSA